MRFFFLNYIISPLYFLPQIAVDEVQNSILRLKLFCSEFRCRQLLFQRGALLRRKEKALTQDGIGRDTDQNFINPRHNVSPVLSLNA